MIWISSVQIQTLIPFPPIVAGTITGLVTVLLTFRFYRERDEINALRAVKSESEQNGQIARQIVEYIAHDLSLRDSDQERSDISESFQITAFEHIKNSGVLARISSETRTKIERHYSQVEWVNRQLMYQENLRAGSARAMSGYSDRITNLNQLVFAHLLRIVSLDDSSDAIIEIDSQIEADELIGEDEINFSEIAELCETELEERILSRFL